MSLIPSLLFIQNLSSLKYLIASICINLNRFHVALLNTFQSYSNCRGLLLISETQMVFKKLILSEQHSWLPVQFQFITAAIVSHSIIQKQSDYDELNHSHHAMFNILSPHVDFPFLSLFSPICRWFS